MGTEEKKQIPRNDGLTQGRVPKDRDGRASRQTDGWEAARGSAIKHPRRYMVLSRWTAGPCDLLLRLGGLACGSCCQLCFDDATDQLPGPFDESQMVGQTAIKDHTDAIVAGKIGGRDQNFVSRGAHVA